MPHTEHVPAASASAAKKSGKKKKSQPGRYSQLVVDTIRKLGERNGSSLAKIYGEAKNVSWFDQQNGRTYLKYSVKALVQNDTLIQVKGIGANGSFRLNKAKLAGLPLTKKPAAASGKKSAATAGKKRAAASPKKAAKKAKPAAKKTPKKAARSPKKTPTKAAKKVKTPAKPKALRARKAK